MSQGQGFWQSPGALTGQAWLSRVWNLIRAPPTGLQHDKINLAPKTAHVAIKHVLQTAGLASTMVLERWWSSLYTRLVHCKMDRSG